MLLLEKINELGTTVLVVTHEKERSTLFSSASSPSTPEESSVTDWTGTTDMKLNRFNYLMAQGVKTSSRTVSCPSRRSRSSLRACFIMGSFSLLTLNIDANIDRLQKPERGHCLRR